MEEYKLKYLKSFLHTFRVPLGSLTEFVHAQEKLVRGCYENSYSKNLIKFGKGKVQLSEVMLLDGVFMIQLFLKNHFRDLRGMGDDIFDNPWVSKDVVRDLLLLENQLPLKFVSSLYETFILAHGNLNKILDFGANSGAPSFFELVQDYFKDVENSKTLELTPMCYSAHHLVEFLAILHKNPESHGNDGYFEPKLDGRKRRWGRKRGEKFEPTYCPTVKELETAGVQFEAAAVEQKYLFAVEFNKDTGKLRIPPIVINDPMETFLRNVIAFEQTAGYQSKYITSYVILLDNLIESGKDVQILMNENILTNEFGTIDQVSDVFNSLYKEVVTDPKEFHFLKTCDELNDYSKDELHKFNSKCANAYALLKRDYFNTAWSGISVCAAAFVILLTVIQTFCSLVSLKS